MPSEPGVSPFYIRQELLFDYLLWLVLSGLANLIFDLLVLLVGGLKLSMQLLQLVGDELTTPIGGPFLMVFLNLAVKDGIDLLGQFLHLPPPFLYAPRQLMNNYFSY